MTPPSLRLLNALAPDPFENVWRAISQFDFLVFAITQEMNRLKIDDVYARQIQNHAGIRILNPLAEFFDAIGADPTDQAQNYSTTVLFCFNPEHLDARCF
jgi:hypothetical protein